MTGKHLLWPIDAEQIDIFHRGARADLMLGSTDSLEATSSNATRATYNYEVDTPMTGSLTSGGKDFACVPYYSLSLILSNRLKKNRCIYVSLSENNKRLATT